MIRLLVSLALVALLGACVGVSGDCAKLAGPGFSKLDRPPPDSAELLTRANLSKDSDLLWFGQGPDKVVICDHSPSIVHPGCGGSTAYPFDRVNGKWVARGLSLDICKDPNN